MPRQRRSSAWTATRPSSRIGTARRRSIFATRRTPGRARCMPTSAWPTGSLRRTRRAERNYGRGSPHSTPIRSRRALASKTSWLGWRNSSAEWWKPYALRCGARRRREFPKMISAMNRRQFLLHASMAGAAAGLSRVPALRAAGTGRPPRILLRSSWQSVNIGDIGHTPGALSLLEKYFPEAEVTLWPTELGHGSRELLTKGYPRLKIVEGGLGSDGKPATAALATAWEETDLYVSGSGSGFPAHSHAAAFHRATGKPVGVFGVSSDPISGIGNDRDPEGGTLKSIHERALKLSPTHLRGDMRYIIDRAVFFFCRDTISRDYLKAQRVKTPILEFGPDAQLGMHLRDDAKGLAYLKAHGLEAGKFICVIPRLRYTPYYRIRNVPRVAADDIKDAINNRTTENDHAKLREMIVSYVRNTGNKVLAC